MHGRQVNTNIIDCFSVLQKLLRHLMPKMIKCTDVKPVVVLQISQGTGGCLCFYITSAITQGKIRYGQESYKVVPIKDYI